MDKLLLLGLQHVLEVYRLVRLSHSSRINALKEVARHRRVDPQTVTSACTRSLGINTYDLEDFLLPRNSKAFCEHLVRRFPSYQKEIESYFNQLEGKQTGSNDDPIRMIRTIFPDEKKDLFRLLLLYDIEKELLIWSERSDIPVDVRNKMDEIKKRIDSA